MVTQITYFQNYKRLKNLILKRTITKVPRVRRLQSSNQSIIRSVREEYKDYRTIIKVHLSREWLLGSTVLTNKSYSHYKQMQLLKFQIKREVQLFNNNNLTSNTKYHHHAPFTLISQHRDNIRTQSSKSTLKVPFRKMHLITNKQQEKT